MTSVSAVRTDTADRLARSRLTLSSPILTGWTIVTLLRLHGHRDLRRRVEELLGGYRDTLRSCLDGLTENEARLHLVPSSTTLRGLVKHVTYVEVVPTFSAKRSWRTELQRPSGSVKESRDGGE
jgi:Protein of unknown function (DUF664)